MVPYCTGTKPGKYSDLYSEGTVSYSGFWHDDDCETAVDSVTTFASVKPKPTKYQTKDIEDFLRKKLWRKEQFKLNKIKEV